MPGISIYSCLKSIIQTLSVYGWRINQESVISDTVDGIIIVIDIIEMFSVLAGEHSILHRLVNCTETHEVHIISGNLVHVKVCPFLSLEFLQIVLCGNKPSGKVLQIGDVGILTHIGITGFKSLRPFSIEIIHILEQCKVMPVVKHFPALHPAVVKPRNTFKSEYAFSGFVIIKVILPDKNQIIIGSKPVKNKNRESIHRCSYIVGVCVFSGFFLGFGTTYIFPVYSGICHNFIP